MVSNAEEILKTLLYFDIFDYPLKKDEIYKFLTTDKISKKELFQFLQTPQKEIEQKQEYFFLKGRQEIVKTRISREKISLAKIKKAKTIIRKISFIPTVKFVGISGALSMNNCTLDDDIDIFVISEKSLVWTTRILIVILLKFLGVYRSRNDKSVSNKICLNMIIAENKLNLKGNLYLAHEIVQLLPIFDKEKTYKKFIDSNNWTKDFLPNVYDDRKISLAKNKSLSDKIWIFIFNFLNLEETFKFIQFNYMKRNINKEIIKDGFLAFHPFNYKTYALNKYAKKLKEYKLKN